MRNYLIVLFLLILFYSSCENNTNKLNGENRLVESMKEDIKNYPALLIGTYTRDMGFVNGKAKGIHTGYLKDGQVFITNTVDVGPNPSYITKDPIRGFVYVVNEIGGTKDEPYGTVTALKIDSLMDVEILNIRSSGGISPCHVSVNKNSTYVFVANYSSGSINSLPISLEGTTVRSAGSISFVGKGPTKRQTEPHAHYIKQGLDDLIYAVDLGTDAVRVYKMNSGTLEPYEHQIKLKPGAGPRHLAFHKTQPHLYILNELNGTIEVWQSIRDKPFKRIQTIGTLSGATKGNDASSAAIKITPNGKFLYASNRGTYNSISSYAIKPNGKLEYTGITKSLGSSPRDFEIDPSGSYLVVANQDSDNIVTYNLDQRTGALSDPKITEGVMTPVCITFL